MTTSSTSLQALTDFLAYEVLGIAAGEDKAAADIDEELAAIAPLSDDEVSRLLAEDGRPETALRQYDAWERLLAPTGEVPAAETQTLVQQLRASTRPVDPDSVFSPAFDPPLLPSGRVTFLLTDIEHHMQQWQEAGSAFRQALLQMREPLRTASGLTVLTRTPYCPPSSARQRARCASAALAAE